MKSEKTDLHNPHPIQKRKVFPIEILSNYIIRTLDSKIYYYYLHTLRVDNRKASFTPLSSTVG